eukprot:2442840-Rhodomonas_salina.1
MATLPESDDTSPGLSASSPNEAQAVCVVASLTKELACTKREEEELRKTADLCWVREQEAKRKLKELEAENRELNKYTEQVRTRLRRWRVLSITSSCRYLCCGVMGLCLLRGAVEACLHSQACKISTGV